MAEFFVSYGFTTPNLSTGLGCCTITAKKFNLKEFVETIQNFDGMKDNNVVILFFQKI